MDKKKIWGLLLIALLVVVLLANYRESVEVRLLIASVDMRAPYGYLGFTSLGVLIGILLK
jgi:uncharacterized integral membrane protein